MFQFGIGGMFGNPVGGNLATPTGPQQFGTIQDVSVEFTQKLVELYGQNKFPEDVAPSDMKVSGKGAFAKIEIELFNALYFAETIATGVEIVKDREAATVPATPGPYTVTVAEATDFVKDLGVLYAATGKPLEKVNPGSEATGKYSVDEVTPGQGIYTFAAGDQAADVLISYVYSDTGGRTLTVTNRIQGYGPVFELYLLQPYQGTNGLHLYACRASKMSAPMKRDNYLISDFEFQAFANAAGKVFDWFQVSN
jgi:hypothetical protein